MRSCICLFYLALMTPTGAAAFLAAPQTTPAAVDADALYRDREQPASARAAEKVWADRLALDGADFEAAWKLARVRYWLGTNAPGTSEVKKRSLEQAMAAAKAAMTARPDAVEGHFWMAAGMGALADAHGLRQGMRYRTPIRVALEKAHALDAAYLDGSPGRALGRWYHKVPGLFGGDVAKSETYLRQALTHNPRSIITLLFLGETLIARGKRDEARTMLQAALDAPLDAEWTPEDTRFKAQVRKLLATLK